MAEIVDRSGACSPAAFLGDPVVASAPSLSVMVIDSDRCLLGYIRTILEDGQREVITCESAEHALECMRGGVHPDVVLASVSLADMHSVELLTRIRKEHPRASVVFMSHVSECGTLVPAFREGVRDILLKPFAPEDLRELLCVLTPVKACETENPSTEIAIGSNTSFVFSSPAMRELKEHACLVARVNLPVLILGESGTGKEVLARFIHSVSRQANRTFLKVNCAALPSELLESELFGYEPGAFTGAVRSKPGKFRQCDKGTIFLDEIGELHPCLQAKLLQVLQDGSFAPLGSRTTEKVNVRVLAATNVDMKAAIAQKTFREDLYYRLNGFCLRLPPLRERRDEIPVMLDYFLRKCSYEMGLSDPQLVLSSRLGNACLQYDWPGNLRELESFVKRYLVMGDEQLMIEELRQDVRVPEPEEVAISSDAISEALSACGGNRRNAATALGISYKVLLNRMRKLGMDSARGPQEVY
jgi:two-component system, NtrC family, response regulator AtoC